uniref:Uncharacterized protein n=1 Tax=Oryza rufipogon TaxID=4529 RepID=A0A0E0RHN1_ORYRU
MRRHGRRRRLPSSPPSQIWPEEGGGRPAGATAATMRAGGRRWLPSPPPSQNSPTLGGLNSQTCHHLLHLLHHLFQLAAFFFRSKMFHSLQTS